MHRVWRLVDERPGISKIAEWPRPEWELEETLQALRRKTHLTIKKVTEDIEDRFHFNTAVSAVMELVNLLYQGEEKRKESDPNTLSVLREALESVVVLLSPIVPHISEELWGLLGHTEGIFQVSWPRHEEEIIKEKEVLLVVQVNGKLRGRIMVAVHASEDEIRERVMDNPRIQEFLKGQTIKKFVFIPKRLVNLVV